MPKVRPLTQEQKEKTRWQKADDNFRAQIDLLLYKSDMNKIELAHRLGIKSYATMETRYKHPSKLKKAEERRLASLFEEFGLIYDFTMGDVTNAVVVD